MDRINEPTKDNPEVITLWHTTELIRDCWIETPKNAPPVFILRQFRIKENGEVFRTEMRLTKQAVSELFAALGTYQQVVANHEEDNRRKVGQVA